MQCWNAIGDTHLKATTGKTILLMIWCNLTQKFIELTAINHFATDLDRV